MWRDELEFGSGMMSLVGNEELNMLTLKFKEFPSWQIELRDWSIGAVLFEALRGGLFKERFRWRDICKTFEK